MNTDQKTRLEIMRALDKEFPKLLFEDLLHVARYIEHGGAEPEPPEPDETPHMPDEPRKWTSLAHIPDAVKWVKDCEGELINRIVGAEHIPWEFANLDYEDLPMDEDGPFTEVLS